jgi:3-hydroxyacyl-CoA dehydrogenase/enoyl-CoA hydratase/3-hydroxybutyryl-CoA epimerase
MDNFIIDINADGIAILQLSVANRRVNTITSSVIQEFGLLANRVRNDAAIRAVILTSARENGFCAGADLGDMSGNIRRWQAAAAPDELAATLDECAALGRHLRALETCGKPLVAAVNGIALGGGFEILLACHRRIAVDDPGIRFAFPEAGLGLMPGAGGTQRLLRGVGIDNALPYLMEGRSMTAPEARRLGILDTLVPAGRLIEGARNLLSTETEPVASWDRRGFEIPGGGIFSAAGYRAFTLANGRLRKRTAGNYPAQENILKAVYQGSLVGMDAALRIESRYFLKTIRSPQATAMLRSLFWSKQELSKDQLRPPGLPKFVVSRSAVLGAGMMGSGIAYEHALAGIPTVLLDVDLANAERGKRHIAGLFERAVAAKRIAPEEAVAALALIKPTSEYSEIDRADLIIEAVHERRALKAEVTGQAELGLAPGGIFGTNTSTLPIDGLAMAARHPGAFIGIHFFSPVDRMSLVEIIVGPRTDAATLAKAVDYVLALRKTPIVVRDSRGFYTSRTFNTYVSEGLALLEEGVAPSLIDNIGRLTSMPRGPLELADDVGLDLLLAVEKQADEDLGEQNIDSKRRILDALVTGHGRHGRKNAMGIYDYPEGGSKMLWPGLSSVVPVRVSSTDAGLHVDIRDRLLYRQALEASRCIAEGVISDPRQADVGALLGWGFASWTGGPLSFIDMMGVAAFVARSQELAAKYGVRFSPPPLLLDMAARGEAFYPATSPQSEPAGGI